MMLKSLPWGLAAYVAVALGCSSPDPVTAIDVPPVEVSTDTAAGDSEVSSMDVASGDGPGQDLVSTGDSQDVTQTDAKLELAPTEDLSTSDVSDGAVTDGAVTDGAVTDGAVGDGAVTDGAVGDGAVGDGPDGVSEDSPGDVSVGCADGGTSCSGSCVNTQTDPSHCGACGAACNLSNAMSACRMGACAVTTCAAGFADCNAMAADGCEVNLNAAVTNCGACGRICAAANASGACVMGTCTVGTCTAGFGDCNDNPADGCEVNLNTTATACGACGTACSLPRATTACTAGRCAVSICDAGFGDCNLTAADGCEAALNTNTNCGACGTACTLGTRCSMGACVSSCPPDTTFCPELLICVNTATDLSNCGMCGRACPAPANGTSTCAMGTCGITCNAGFADCNMMAADGCETNLNTSAGNCARCANACSLANATAACSAGSCTVSTCSVGFGDCDSNPANGCEVNLNTTAASCGACGSTCIVSHAIAGCAAARCTVATCTDGFADCNMNAADGCETATTTNANCGGCGTVCMGGTRCAGSSCVSSCPAGTTFCMATGVCASFGTDTANCGMCGTVCPGVANAAPACTAGVCGFSCNAGFADCDNSAANGCEVNLGTNPSNCGNCGTACTLANARSVCSSGGCTIGACNTGFGDCNGNPADGCEVNLQTTLTACGSCTRVCAATNGTPSCTAGLCGIASCESGFGNCDMAISNGCETALNTNTHCGACGMRCGTGTFCSGGSCVSMCAVSTMYCNRAMACFNLATDVNNCGACGNVCPTRANSAPTCASGACGVSCASGFANCNSNAADGCEVNIATSPTNCGACSATCTLANALNSCTSGACSISACNGGFGNCNGVAADGCEVNLNTTATSCGACGNNCVLPNATAGCASGSCTVASCNAGFGNCNGRADDGCERALNTNTNCGTCGTRCAAGQTCSGGVCASTCATGTTFCASTGSCVDLQTNPDNCGMCNNVCPSYPRTTRNCMTGTCSATCNSGFGNCDGNIGNGCETNLNTSVNHCGACRTVCNLPNATEGCSLGVCSIAACDFGFANCDGVAANGCEANLLSSTTHCGTCRNACATGQVCRFGGCRGG